MNLPGKIVLITGAARRIGRAIACELARAGAHIVIHYHDSRREALSLQKEIRALGSDAFLVPADFSFHPKPVSSEIQKFVRAVYREVPRVDVLVNNASIFYPTELARITEKIWDDFLNVNLKVPFLLAQAFGLRMMKRKSGKIINLVDWTGFRPQPRYLPYTISKAGLIAATTGLAKALAPHVQVLGIAPGPILEPAGLTAAARKKIIARTPLKRFGAPEDIAKSVRFLIEGTDYITGAILPVDGGNLMV